MNISRHLFHSIVISLAATVVCAAEQQPVYSLIVSTSKVEAGARIEVQIAALNPSANAITVANPGTLNGELIAAGSRIPLKFEPRDTAQTSRASIGPGRFTLQTYATRIPPDAQAGIAALDVQLAGADAVRTAIEISSSPVVASKDGGAATQRPTTNLVRAQPTAEALRRIFADRLAPHEPTYFVYGPDDPVAKFQISFKYKLLDFQDLGSQRLLRTLQFGFTQRSLWDIEGDSRPFYDTSYIPELMYQSLAPLPEKANGAFTWLGFQAAFKHESNGRDGPQSRSLNIVYARTVFAFGRLDGWHLLAVPEVFTYVSSRDENTDIANYRGYGKLNLILGRNDGPSFAALLWAGKDWDHVSAQVDFTLPVRTRLLNFETYFLVQYFNGYGESLLSYRTHSETIRAGISLVR